MKNIFLHQVILISDSEPEWKTRTVVQTIDQYDEVILDRLKSALEEPNIQFWLDHIDDFLGINMVWESGDQRHKVTVSTTKEGLINKIIKLELA